MGLEMCRLGHLPSSSTPTEASCKTPVDQPGPVAHGQRPLQRVLGDHRDLSRQDRAVAWRRIPHPDLWLQGLSGFPHDQTLPPCSSYSQKVFLLTSCLVWVCSLTVICFLIVGWESMGVSKEMSLPSRMLHLSLGVMILPSSSFNKHLLIY